jgi:hypothetical protein
VFLQECKPKVSVHCDGSISVASFRMVFLIKLASFLVLFYRFCVPCGGVWRRGFGRDGFLW